MRSNYRKTGITSTKCLYVANNEQYKQKSNSTKPPLILHCFSSTSLSFLHLLPLPSASLITCLHNLILIFPYKFSREFWRYPRTKQPLPRTFPRNSLENLSPSISFSSCKSYLSCALAPASATFLMTTLRTAQRISLDGAEKFSAWPGEILRTAQMCSISGAIVEG